MTDAAQFPPVDPLRYRQVLGQYPTGVCAITAKRGGAESVAMVVGSLASVSLNPPLIAFFPDRASSSWAKLRDCEDFCVNILSAERRLYVENWHRSHRISLRELRITFPRKEIQFWLESLPGSIAADTR